MLRSFFNLQVIRLFSTKRYTKSHQWIEYLPSQQKARIGISNFAQEQLGEIIHVEMPSVGKKVEAAQSAVVIESVKIAADVYTPFAGQISAINKEVEKNPALVNTEAEKSWLFQITCSAEPKDLLSLQEYKKLLDAPH